MAAQVRQPLLLKWAERAQKRAVGRGHAHGHRCHFRLTNRVFPRARDRLFPQRAVTCLDFQREAHHQPAEVAHRPPMRREPRFAAPTARAAGKQPLAHLRHRRVALHHPALAAAVVAQRSQRCAGGRVRAQVRRKQFRFFFIHSAIPHSRFRHTHETGFP